MFTIVLLGLNHTTAPVEIRECLAFSEEDIAAALESLKTRADIGEVIIFSTCNRVEILMTTENTSRALTSAKECISAFKNISVDRFDKMLYTYSGDEAVRHIYRVASSLDSMIVGEPQILGQIKSAYQTATRKKTSGVILNKLMHRTFFVAKRVRSETGIGDHAVSISYAAVELAKKIFGSLEGKEVLLIGAGEMAELAVEHLVRNKSGKVFVANRTFERGVDLAQMYKGQALRFEEIPDSLKHVDIIISSTGSPGFVITREQVRNSMRSRRNRPLFFIDIAVPRDIDPEINKLNNSYVYDIDDLKGVISENIDDRAKEAVKGERIIDEAVIRFRKWFNNLDVVPTIVALREKIEAIAKAEADRTLQSLKHLSDEDSQAVYRMTDALIHKILHDPTDCLKSDGCHRNKSLYLDITRKLFNLDDEKTQK